MTTVFLLKEGSYSDYHVIGIFSTRERAEIALQEYRSDRHSRYDVDDADITETPVDPGIDELMQGLHVWIVLMDSEGNVDTDNGCRRFEQYTSIDMTPVWWWESGTLLPGAPQVLRLRANVWARDEEHAVKIVNEIRAQDIALGRTPPPPKPTRTRPTKKAK